ncbi:MAG: hypothetical protein FJ030_12860 [Chloroflexi bacterium]|nr:hypothetical protein [Chloroflexota bacterium]
MTLDSAHAHVERLVKKFKALSAAERKSLNENATRQGYILPLFRALQWDTDNVTEVSPEEKVSRGWVDFSFRLSGVPRFFLETKKASEDLSDPRWVKQAIDYAWTKSVTWALLSDFEGLRVFNAEWKEDDPFRAQFVEFTVDTYLSDFERLWWLSRPEAAAGRLDREAEKVGKRARREPVSQHLFDDLKVWRHDLFRHLRAYNGMYSPAQIDEAVLRILNRLIFIRTTEDREVEPRRLLPLVRELAEQKRLAHLPRELAKLFRQFDETYNSELFARHFSEELDCESKPYEDLIHDLHEKRFVRYNFNAIDADVLGTAYEQYLGHVITDPEAAEVVEKRQKRKSQGIYFTPTFVVKYIVQQTLGRYLDEHGYSPGNPPRVLDMACGSGSFLIEAFDTLDRFVAQQRGQMTPTPTLPHPKNADGGGSWEGVHDYARRMEILTQCIYGVDKDRQAVEVARLNLLLRALHHRDKLPMLANIRCGDSLISGAPDELRAAFGDEWKSKQAFDWEKELPEVFAPTPTPTLPRSEQHRTGEGVDSPPLSSASLDGGGAGGGGAGFDVIIGNPPYVRIQTLPKDEVAFFNEHFQAATGNYDIYVLFVERALQLLKPGGAMGFILPSKFFNTAYGAGLRKLISDAKALYKIVDFEDAQVFETATTYTCLLFLQKQPSPQIKYVQAGQWLNSQTTTPKSIPDDLPENSLAVTSVSEKEWNFASSNRAELFKTLEGLPTKLEDMTEKIFQGLVTSADPIYILEEKSGSTKSLVSALSKATGKIYRLERGAVVPLLKGALDMRRYRIESVTRYVIFPYHDGKLIPAKTFATHYPNCWAYLKENRKALAGREKGKMDHDGWYGYVYPKSLKLFGQSKLLTPSIANRASFSFDANGEYYFVGSGGGGGGGYGILLKPSEHSPLYTLGLLNSQLLDFYLKSISSPFRHGYYAYNKQYIERLPIRAINFSDPADKARHDALVKLVEEMLELQKERAEAGELDDRRHALARRIGAVDREIDTLVYELYGLTEDEIKIVESKT